MNNWYKISQNLSQLKTLALQYRQQITQGNNDDDFLREQCNKISQSFKRFLISKGIQATITRGVFKIDNPPEYSEDLNNQNNTEDWGDDVYESEEERIEASYYPLHYWVEVNNIIIDLTANQFNDELNSPVSSIEIGTYADLKRYTPITKDY